MHLLLFSMQKEEPMKILALSSDGASMENADYACEEEVDTNDEVLYPKLVLIAMVLLAIRQTLRT